MARCLHATYTVRYRDSEGFVTCGELTPAPLQVLEAGYRCRLHHSGHHIPSAWDNARSFNFDLTGRFLYSCNQRGDNIAAFRVDPKTGGLTFTGHYTLVGNPSIIVFLDLGRR